MSVFIPNEINLFSSSPTAVAYKSIYDEELTPLNPIDLKSGVEFHSNGYNHICKSFTEMYIGFNMQVKKHDDKLYTTTDTPQPRLLNNVGQSLFKSARIYLNNVLAYSIDMTHHYKGIIEAALNTSPSNCLTQYASSGLFPYEMISTKLPAMSSNSKLFDIYFRLNLINTPQLLLPNVSVTIRLEFNGGETLLVEGSTEDSTSKVKTYTKSQVHVNDIKLYIRHYELHETFDRQIEQNLSQKHANYQFKAARISYVSIPSGQSTIHLGNIYSGIIPDLIAMAMVSNTTFAGSRESDSYEFLPFNISEFSFVVNNNRYPRVPYKFEFSETSTMFSRAFSNLYSSIKLRATNKAALMSRESYAKNFMICEDISSSGHALTNINSQLEHSNVGVNISFSKSLENPITLILYMLVPSRISISKTREVLVHY